MSMNEYNPDDVTRPGETLQEILEARDVPLRIPVSVTMVRAIIDDDALITTDIAQTLEKALGTPASFWLNRERRYRESLKRKDHADDHNQD